MFLAAGDGYGGTRRMQLIGATDTQTENINHLELHVVSECTARMLSG